MVIDLVKVWSIIFLSELNSLLLTYRHNDSIISLIDIEGEILKWKNY